MRVSRAQPQNRAVSPIVASRDLAHRLALVAAPDRFLHLARRNWRAPAVTSPWLVSAGSDALTARRRKPPGRRQTIRRQALPTASSDAAPIPDRRHRSLSGDNEGRSDARPSAHGRHCPHRR